MLAGLGGGQVVPGCRHAQFDVAPVVISMAVDYPDRVAGVVYGRDTVLRRLREVGCTVAQTRAAAPTVAPWRAGSSSDQAAADSLRSAARQFRCWSWTSPRRPGGPTSPTRPTWPRR